MGVEVDQLSEYVTTLRSDSVKIKRGPHCNKICDGVDTMSVIVCMRFQCKCEVCMTDEAVRLRDVV